LFDRAGGEGSPRCRRLLFLDQRVPATPFSSLGTGGRGRNNYSFSELFEGAGFDVANERRHGVETRDCKMLDEFACPDCGSPSVTYTDADEDDGHVVCRRCGTYLMTRGQFRRFVEGRGMAGHRRMVSELHVSGC
jgi:hypothetical protein